MQFPQYITMFRGCFKRARDGDCLPSNRKVLPCRLLLSTVLRFRTFLFLQNYCQLKKTWVAIEQSSLTMFDPGGNPAARGQLGCRQQPEPAAEREESPQA